MKRVTTEESDVDIDLAQLSRAVWRRKFGVLATSVIFAGSAFGIASIVPPSYKSETRILIEGRESSYTRNNSVTGTASDDRLSPESVESQVSLMTSAEILGNVADRFNLGQLNEFSPKASLVDRIVTKVRPEADSPQAEVVEKVREHLKVYRVDQTRVIVIEFSTSNPTLARDVPNAIADEYLARQKGALLSSNTNATGWLEGEIKDLREAVRNAEAKVADYRGRSNLLVGQNQNVLSTQQLSEISTELSRTRAARAAAEGRAKSISDALGKGRALDTVSEVLSSPTVQALREREVALRADIADLSTTLLENHPRLRALRSQLRDLDTEIAREAQKVKSSLETEADSARQREVALNVEMERLKKDAAASGSQEVELRSLEREAQSQSQLLESYLTRYREAVARGAKDYLPVDARTFSQAQLPAEPYFPKVLPITAAGGVGGLLIATLWILLDELFSGRALTPSGGRRAPRHDDARFALSVAARPLPASAPVEGKVWQAAPANARIAEPSGATPRPAAAMDDAPAETREAQALEESADPATRPQTASATALELAKAIVSSDMRQILVVSADAPGAQPGSVALARQLVALGRAAILVDLSQAARAAFAMGLRPAAPGLDELLAGDVSFADIIHCDASSASHVVAGVALGASEGELAGLMDALAEAYDLVVVECAGLTRDRLSQIMDDDAAFLVSGDETGVEVAACLTALAREGIDDVVLMASEPPTLFGESARAA